MWYNKTTCKDRRRFNTGRLERKHIDIEKLKELYLSDRMKITDIAKELDCSVATIKRHLKLHINPILRRQGSRLNPSSEINRRIKELYVNEQKTIRETSNILGIDTETVRGRLEILNIPRRTERDFREFHPMTFDRTNKDYEIKDVSELNNTIIYLFKRGESIANIAAILKLDRGTIYRRINFFRRIIRFYTRGCGRCKKDHKSEHKKSKVCVSCNLSNFYRKLDRNLRKEE